LSRKRSRKTLLEISKQPELWIFSNLLAETWIDPKSLNAPFFQKEVNMPISLPTGTCIFKVETDGSEGQVISIVVVNRAEICLFQLMDPYERDLFTKEILNYLRKIYPDNFDYYSYSRKYYNPKMRELGVYSILGYETEIKDLAEYGVKSRILQHISDPIQGYEVPQYWRINERLASLKSKDQNRQALINDLRSKICDRLAKHAVIEGLRCAILVLKHYADLLDSLTSEIKIDQEKEARFLADGLYKLEEYQNSAIFYSKCLSKSSLSDREDNDQILTALKDSIDKMKPQEFLEYALFAAKVARSYEKE